MPRAKKTDGGLGHNSGDLTEDDLTALQHYYTAKIRRETKEADEAKAVYDSKREVVNGTFALVKGELHYSRKDFQANVLDKLNMSDAEFLAEEIKRTTMQKRAGLRVAEPPQMDLALGDTADDKARAERHGRLAGLNADEPSPPDWVSPIFIPDWMREYGLGQAENGALITRAEEILDARAKTAGGLTLQDDEPAAPDTAGGEGESEDDELEAAVEALEEAGWTAPTTEERTFETADA